MTKTPVKTVRCAIYTRKSTDENLNLEFNSLDAQRESGEAYVASQKSEGWFCLSDRYDEGGYTGGNMERPALKRLMADQQFNGAADAKRASVIRSIRAGNHFGTLRPASVGRAMVAGILTSPCFGKKGIAHQRNRQVIRHRRQAA